jgi:hypothetical protein
MATIKKCDRCSATAPVPEGSGGEPFFPAPPGAELPEGWARINVGVSCKHEHHADVSTSEEEIVPPYVHMMMVHTSMELCGACLDLVAEVTGTIRRDAPAPSPAFPPGRPWRPRVVNRPPEH